MHKLAAPILLFASFLIQSASLPIDYFVKPNDYQQAKISPNGKYIATDLWLENQRVLAILDSKTEKLISIYRFKPSEHINEFHWVNHERLVFTSKIKLPKQEEKVSRGQIFSANFDGSQKRILFGIAGKLQPFGNLGKHNRPLRAWGSVLDTLANDSQNIIIGARHMGNGANSSSQLYKLNVYNSKRRSLSKTPLSNMEIVFDTNGTPLSALGRASSGILQLYLYQDSKWLKVTKNHKMFGYRPVNVSLDGTKLYLISNPGNGNDRLSVFDLSRKKIQHLFQHDLADIHQLIYNPSTKEVIGVKTMLGKIQYHFFNPQDPFTQIFSQIVKTFNHQNISITSSANDAEILLLLVSSDKNPGDFYLYSKQNHSLKFLFSRAPSIDPVVMADKQSIKLKTRDGTTIYGYLTLPKNLKNLKNKAPLVTLVHGGPFGRRDSWDFDTQSQILANNGYAVLQVNFRGSAGRGLEFETSAYQKRGTLIQRDIIDATKWAMQHPRVQSDNACIMGWSFGGYSAAMAPLLEPGLFKCAIAASGFYDAITQEKSAAYTRVKPVAAHAKKINGSDPTLLTAQSPIQFVQQFDTPIFIVHGGHDRQVPAKQAFQLKAELDRWNKPYEWMFKEKEGHGFQNPDNLQEFYQRAITFLNKYLDE